MVWFECGVSHALASQSLELSWNSSTSTNVAAYKVYYGTNTGNYDNFNIFGDISDVIIPGLSYGTTYYFAVAALDAWGNESPLSEEASFTIPAEGILELRAQGDPADSQAVDVSWTPSPDGGVYGYQVSYGTESGVYTNSAAFYYTTVGTIYGLAGGTTYYFVVSPIDSNGVEPPASSEASYVVPMPAPIVLSAQTATNPPGVALSWNTVPGTATVGYYVYYGTQSGQYTSTLGYGLVTNIIINGLVGGQTNYFAVAAVDAYGNQGPLSNESSAVAPFPAPIVLQTRILTDDSGNPYYMEINTGMAVYGSWEMDYSTDLQNWTAYTSGYGYGYGNGNDVDVYVPIDSTVPQMFIRVVQ